MRTNNSRIDVRKKKKKHKIIIKDQQKILMTLKTAYLAISKDFYFLGVVSPKDDL
jgi:hypothetical protein